MQMKTDHAGHYLPDSSCSAPPNASLILTTPTCKDAHNWTTSPPLTWTRQSLHCSSFLFCVVVEYKDAGVHWKITIELRRPADRLLYPLIQTIDMFIKNWPHDHPSRDHLLAPHEGLGKSHKQNLLYNYTPPPSLLSRFHYDIIPNFFLSTLATPTSHLWHWSFTWARQAHTLLTCVTLKKGVQFCS
jgi:hypothetical protein